MSDCAILRMVMTYPLLYSLRASLPILPNLWNHTHNHSTAGHLYGVFLVSRTTSCAPFQPHTVLACINSRLTELRTWLFFSRPSRVRSLLGGFTRANLNLPEHIGYKGRCRHHASVPSHVIRPRHHSRMRKASLYHRFVNANSPRWFSAVVLEHSRTRLPARAEMTDGNKTRQRCRGLVAWLPCARGTVASMSQTDVFSTNMNRRR